MDANDPFSWRKVWWSFTRPRELDWLQVAVLAFGCGMVVGILIP